MEVHAKKRHALIAAPDRWGVGNGAPILVKQYPNLAQIFSRFNPFALWSLLNKREHFWKKQDRQYARYRLAMTYLAHPEPSVRAAMIQHFPTFDRVDMLPILVDMLFDSSEQVRAVAAKVIWNKTWHASLAENGVVYALGCLRNLILETGGAYIERREMAQLALTSLCKICPERRREFDRWLIYVCCYGDKRLADYGDRLLGIYAHENTFMGTAVTPCLQLGIEIKKRDGSIAMQIVTEAIQMTLGTRASRQLAAVWQGNKPQGFWKPLRFCGAQTC